MSQAPSGCSVAPLVLASAFGPWSGPCGTGASAGPTRCVRTSSRRPRRTPPRRRRRPLDGLDHDPGERATLLQFSSAFCAPCRATRRVLGEVAELVPGVAPRRGGRRAPPRAGAPARHRPHPDHAHPRRPRAARSPGRAGPRPGTRCWPPWAGSSRKQRPSHPRIADPAPTRQFGRRGATSVTGHHAGTVRRCSRPGTPPTRQQLRDTPVRRPSRCRVGRGGRWVAVRGCLH